MQKLARQYLREYVSFTIEIHWGDLNDIIVIDVDL